MPSESERGAYGTGRKVKNWEIYNPLGVKIKKFKEESVCAICSSKADFLFPITFDACPSCAEKIMERKDVYWEATKKIDLSGHFCNICGNFSIVYYTINTRICHRCTVQLGKQQKRFRELMSIARKVDKV
ncbi:MAG: hypothetical protein QXF80_06655 [Thermoplasmatales archaeon]